MSLHDSHAVRGTVHISTPYKSISDYLIKIEVRDCQLSHQDHDLRQARLTRLGTMTKIKRETSRMYCYSQNRRTSRAGAASRLTHPSVPRTTCGL